MSARAVELSVDRLVLHGFAPADRARIAAAVAGELARLVAEGGFPEAAARRADGAARLDGGAFRVPRGASPEAVGAGVARAVYAAATGGAEGR